MAQYKKGNLITGTKEDLKFRAHVFSNNARKFLKNMSLNRICRIVSIATFIFALAKFSSGCTVVPGLGANQQKEIEMTLPQEISEEAEGKQEQTQEAIPAPEPTLSPEEMREQRLNEIAEAVKANDYRFTVEELSNYLKEHGTGWEGGIEAWMRYYQGTLATFQYYFVENNKDDSGVYLSPAPFQFSEDITFYENNNFESPYMIDERYISKILESIYVDMFILEDGKYRAGWEKESGKYTTIIYMAQETCKDGKPYDVMILGMGGFFFKDEKGEPIHVDWDDIVNKDLSDEELDLFTDDVIASLKAKEGWTMFIFDEDGNLDEKRFNAKDLYNLLHLPTTSDTLTSENN